MAPLLPASLWTFLSAFLLISAENITREEGTTVTLPCHEPKNVTVKTAEWTRKDLGNEYVVLFRNKKLDSGHQHQSYVGRVSLDFNQMKHGNVSLVLKNVKTNDTGLYECHIVKAGTNRRKRSTYDTEPIKTIYLTVIEPGSLSEVNMKSEDKGEENMDDNRQITTRSNWIPLLVVLLVVGALGFMKYKQQRKPQHPSVVTSQEQLM